MFSLSQRVIPLHLAHFVYSFECLFFPIDHSALFLTFILYWGVVDVSCCVSHRCMAE